MIESVKKIQSLKNKNIIYPKEKKSPRLQFTQRKKKKLYKSKYAKMLY